MAADCLPTNVASLIGNRAAAAMLSKLTALFRCNDDSVFPEQAAHWLNPSQPLRPVRQFGSLVCRSDAC
jgi:hypothetical protein